MQAAAFPARGKTEVPIQAHPATRLATDAARFRSVSIGQIDRYLAAAREAGPRHSPTI